jgi:hypothetical protein
MTVALLVGKAGAEVVRESGRSPKHGGRWRPELHCRPRRASVDRPVVGFDPKIDQEHRKLIEQRGPTRVVGPDTPIQRRLDG